MNEVKKLIFNGDIITINSNLDQSEIEAVAIEGEKIIGVGSIDKLRNLLDENYEEINLEGHCILPGFIDSHIHPILYIFFLLSPDLSNLRSLSELKSFLKENIKNKNKEKIILCLKLNEENFKNPILPKKWDLDEAVPDHPIFLLRYDFHIGVANSKALEIAGINENTIPPDGGEIRKNKNRELNGVISEQALSLIFSQIELPTLEEIKRGAERAFKNLAKRGITSIHGVFQADSGGEFGDLGALEIPIYKSILEKILQNTYSLTSTQNPKKLIHLKNTSIDLENKYGKFKLGGLKLFLDGTFGAATACLFKEFTDKPNKKGYCVVELDEIYEQMLEAHKLGFQVAVHAIGDKGNRILVDLYKELLKEFPKLNHRHRIEHASMLKNDVIKDMKELGLIASCQPPFLNSEYKWLEKRLGKERCKYTYPFKSIIDSGVILTAGSDCPVEDPDVIMGIHAMVNRNGFIPEECVSVEEAIKAYTINGAYASFQEDIKGTIEKGKLADFVILNENPLKIPKNEIKNLKILETIIRGETVYKRES
ncbi:MAG: amidohydrolase [Candidatus Lokiarchaeota archaeon]